jgi:thioredoxin 1
VCGLFVLQQTFADTANPYDETADAKADIAAALMRAQAENKLMLITFGANWCPDCRAFDTAIHQPELATTIDERYVLVKVDVGNWDKNIDVVQRFDNPIAGGIPSIVVVDAQEHNLYATKAGQLAASRNMSASEFARFFEAMATLQYQPPG